MNIHARMKSLKLALSALAVLTSGAAGAETLRIGGTGVALGGMTVLGEAFEAKHPDVDVTVLPSLGSGGGMKALFADAIDLAVTSRPVKDAEIEQGAIPQQYARTELAVVTSLGTAVDQVTPDQLAAIYAGKMTEWPDGAPVRLVLRPMDEADTQLLRAMSDEMERSVDMALERQGMLNAINDQENAETLEELDGSVGLVATSQIATEKRKLKVLRLVSSSKAPGSSGRPDKSLVKGLYIVQTASTKPVAKEFAAFVVSGEGREILEQYDHLPAE